MQTKVVFYSGNSNSAFNCAYKEINIGKDTNENLGDKVAEFNEYEFINIRFESDDPNARLEVDCSFGEEALILYPSEKYTSICDEGDYDVMFTPGYYGIKINVYGKQFYGNYFINPKNISWAELINLRNHLDKIINGISKNIFIERMSNEDFLDSSNSISILEQYNYINNSINNFSIALEQIIRNPITELIKEYRELNYSKVQDNKSQRWLVTKGAHKNRNPYIPEVCFEKHSVISNDILPNRWVKKCLSEVIDKIFQVQEQYNLIIQGMIVKSEKLKVDIIKITNSLKKIEKDYIISSSHKYNQKKELEFIQDQLNNTTRNILFLQERMDNLKKITSYFILIKKDTWLCNINDEKNGKSVSNKVFKNKRYYNYYECYNKIINPQNSISKNVQLRFENKKTSLLFEYYSLFLVINVFLSEKYKIQKGWITELLNNQTEIVDIPVNEKIIMIKDDMRCEVVYEKVVMPIDKLLKENISDLTRNNTRHYKPDITITILNNKTDELLHCIIVEVKCRGEKYLFSNNGPTKVIEQARDYYNFGYYNVLNKKSTRAVVDKVIILYPKQNDNEIIYSLHDVNLNFIQVEANSNNIEEHYGFDKLKESILEVI